MVIKSETPGCIYCKGEMGNTNKWMHHFCARDAMGKIRRILWNWNALGLPNETKNQDN